jgi:type I restriction enzyme M protein
LPSSPRRTVSSHCTTISPYTFERLLEDPDGIARNLTAYIKGFSPKAQEIFEKFAFESQIQKLEDANRLFIVVMGFAGVNLHPDRVSNIEMGYIFEELVRRFNEQANEEAGDHFTPREVIRLMAHLLYTEDEEIYLPGIVRTIYDPACGTGGMLSVSEEYIREHNPQAHLELFGQDYNDESYAICCSDLLIKDEPVDNVVCGNSLGDGRTRDGHEGNRFHYMLANAPFGVEWKPEEHVIKREHRTLGFRGRFGPGLPRINDGALLFLLHMISKMQPSPDDDGEGSKIAIVFNGSPLFTGEPGPSESNIRRWIIENDWLDAIIALPDQLFYNTGIFTYIWIVTNRKPTKRRGYIQLIDATRHFVKMRKSLGNKRNEIGDGRDGKPNHIDDITRLYAAGEHDAKSTVISNGKPVERVCSKMFPNHAFGYLKLTVERPLRLNFQASPDRIARLENENAFKALAQSKKRKHRSAIEAAVEAGRMEQAKIMAMLAGMDGHPLYKDRDSFTDALDEACRRAGNKPKAPIRKAILSAPSERDSSAEICRDAAGNPEPDSELRDAEIVPLPGWASLPLPMDYARDDLNGGLVVMFRDYCDDYFAREVTPHWRDAWIDYSKTKVGYEIPITRHFYTYEPPRHWTRSKPILRSLKARSSRC